jgi:acyl-CoA reductase-like NAD-dependent aldehyde dehydrogenase
MVANRDMLGMELTLQMGRPIRYAPKEIDTMAHRAKFMSGAAAGCLSDIRLERLPGFDRFIRREPLGLVFAIMPWNYPYLTAVNTVVPALLAGNTVVLKHSPHTPLAAERMAEAFAEAGLPEGVFQYLHASPDQTEWIVRRNEVDFVAFTGSVAVGRQVQRAASERFIGVGLELGGKDPAYVRSDADLAFTIENVLEGALFNSGQSCCAIERVYVHRDVYDEFVAGAVSVANSYVLGDPLDAETTLGPLVRTSSAEFVRGQISEAVGQGARALLDESDFPTSKAGSPYLAPQILVNVNHSMRIMNEETFGPIVGVMPVDCDEEAVTLMNDSRFGLTASIWTRNLQAGLSVADSVNTGTVFINRCDTLDPELPWVGVKDSGRGCTLSRLGFDSLTRPKSFHLRIQS